MKSILVFSSVLFISIAAIFQTNNVVITSSLPNYAKPGESVDFKIMVSKGELSGFSKLEMMFPVGFEIAAVDIKGGAFSFVDQKLKVIWVSLPSDPKFSVSFRVNIKSGVAGSFPLEGLFSYIQDGIRTNESYNTNIFIAEERPAALATIAAKVDAEKSRSETSGETVDNPTVSSVAASPSSPGIVFSRSLSSSNLKPSESTTVKLTVGKKGISGFGKITEILPEGFTAEEIQSNGAIFSVLNDEVRFLWMTLPASDSFEITYKLVAGTQLGEQSIKGSFSYVEGTKTRLNSTVTTSMEVRSEEVVASTATVPTSGTTETVNEETETVDVVVDATTVAAEAAENTAGSAELDNSKTSTEVASSIAEIVEPTASVKPATTKAAVVSTSVAPETTTETATVSTEAVASTPSNGEVSYRVQICATRKGVDKKYFAKHNNVSETIYADMHDGWHKFTIGAFDIYGAARDHREKVKETNKITGPFVTAYNSGSRITVQEALMISKHKWMP